jgi:hypothetical protein
LNSSALKAHTNAKELKNRHNIKEKRRVRVREISPHHKGKHTKDEL